MTPQTAAIRACLEELTVHIATKILLVFCAVLSLLLAALTMSFAANARALRAEFSNERARATQATADAQALTAAAGQNRVAVEESRKALETQVDSAKSTIAQLQAERTSLRADLERAVSDAASIRAQISQLGATTETQTALIKNYRDEVTTLRDSMLSKERREIELTDRINELSGQREVLEQNARALKEQLEETKLALQTSQQSGSGAGGVGGVGLASGMTASTVATRVATELSGPIVRGRVSEVFRSPAGDDMVVITEGSNRGIRIGTRMNIVRNNDTFVASIEIISVEPTRAVGKVTMLARATVAPVAEDTVLSRLN